MAVTVPVVEFMLPEVTFCPLVKRPWPHRRHDNWGVLLHGDARKTAVGGDVVTVQKADGFQVTRQIVELVESGKRNGIEWELWTKGPVPQGQRRFRINQGEDERQIDHPPVERFNNCTKLWEAGWDLGVSRDGGTYGAEWDEAEKAVYELNASRDRDKDGRACNTWKSRGQMGAIPRVYVRMSCDVEVNLIPVGGPVRYYEGNEYDLSIHEATVLVADGLAVIE